MKTSACLAALMLCSCASVQRPAAIQDVEQRMILPAGVERITPRDHEKFVFPSPISTEAPTFPQGRVGDLDATICVELVVTAVGRVESVRQIRPEDACTPLGDRSSVDLFRAVDHAVRGWSFFAAGLCRFDVAAAECDQPGAVVRPIALKLAYAFRFKRTGARASVESTSIRH